MLYQFRRRNRIHTEYIILQIQNTHSPKYQIHTHTVCISFVICVSVSWKILALDLVNLECLSEKLFGDNHPLTTVRLVCTKGGPTSLLF